MNYISEYTFFILHHKRNKYASLLTSLGIIVILWHGRSASRTLTDIIPHKSECTTRCLKISLSTIISLVTRPYLHVTIMMSIQITPHNNLISFRVDTLTHPWHRSTSLVEPRVRIVGTAAKFTANVIVEVETMVTILGGRAADTGTSRAVLMGEEVS